MFVIIFAICNKIEKLAKNTKMTIPLFNKLPWLIGTIVVKWFLEMYYGKTMLSGQILIGMAYCFWDSPKIMQ